MSNGLIIFIKNPEIGKVKTRLAKTIGNEKALEVYQLLQERTKKVSLGVNARRFLFYSENIAQNDQWSNQDFDKLLQVDGDLGNRMIAAIQAVFSMGSNKTIIIGSDCYDITSEIIESAFQKLDHSDVVIGPANDGGYYLIGMKKMHQDIFQNIEWSTETVFENTINKVVQKGRSYEVLPTLIDIDTEEDLKASSFNLRILSLT